MPLAGDPVLLADALVEDAAELALLALLEAADDVAEEDTSTAPKTPPTTSDGAEEDPAFAAALL